MSFSTEKEEGGSEVKIDRQWVRVVALVGSWGLFGPQAVWAQAHCCEQV
jgi:hypothetical protein